MTSAQGAVHKDSRAPAAERLFRLAAEQGDAVALAAELSMSDVQLVGIVKPVLPMHIYNVCLGRGSLPAFVLDIRASAEFRASHLVNSVNCPVDSPAVTFADMEKCLVSTPAALQRLRNRENSTVAIVGNDIAVVEAVAKEVARDISKSYTVVFCHQPFSAFRHSHPYMLLASPATELPFQLKSLPSEIIADQLYLGNQWTATSDDAMSALKITAVANCAREMENFFEREGPHGAAGIPYCRIEVDDKQSQALVPHFNIAIEFIHSAIKKGGRVLVHCAMGQSRSASIVIAYVMATKQMDADQATEYVRRRKGDIKPNPGFQKELKEYEKIILGDGAVVCGLPVVFESLCEKKGGGPDGQRNWLKGGRRNWKERYLRLTQRWLQYLDGPLPGGVVKGSKEVSQDWVVAFNSKHANAITIECGGDDVFNVRFSNAELCRKWMDVLTETSANASHLYSATRQSSSIHEFAPRP